MNIGDLRAIQGPWFPSTVIDALISEDEACLYYALDRVKTLEDVAYLMSTVFNGSPTTADRKRGYRYTPTYGFENECLEWTLSEKFGNETVRWIRDAMAVKLPFMGPDLNYAAFVLYLNRNAEDIAFYPSAGKLYLFVDGEGAKMPGSSLLGGNYLQGAIVMRSRQ